ncbi:mechanosensitive ion channel family protein, partial [Hyphomonas sp.]|uniref:mechanosensitive ion channel family protein n=1 Tax=Hyphomonas sp. TaxID=87 RepID=UPI0039E70F6F
MMPEFDMTGWPAWAQAAEPQVLKWSLVLAATIAIWIVAVLVKRLVALFGRLVTPKDQDFEGSSWDLGASVTRMFALILMSPLPLGLAGYDWRTLVESRGPGAVAAVAILLVAILFANWVARSMRNFGGKAHRRTGADDTLFAFAGSLVKYLIFAVAIVTALTQLGFPTTSLAAVLGALGLAIGLGLQDTMKSVAAGVMLAILRPFRIGDYVSLAGLEGEVTEISPFTTSLKQVDNKIVIVTNDKVWSDALVNHTRQTRRKFDLYFDMSYDDNMDHALKVLLDTANDHPRVLSKAETWVGVHALADWS